MPCAGRWKAALVNRNAVLQCSALSLAFGRKRTPEPCGCRMYDAARKEIGDGARLFSLAAIPSCGRASARAASRPARGCACLASLGFSSLAVSHHQPRRSRGKAERPPRLMARARAGPAKGGISRERYKPAQRWVNFPCGVMSPGIGCERLIRQVIFGIPIQL